MEVVVVGVGMCQVGVQALLVVQELGARLEAAVAAQAGEGGDLCGVRAACGGGGCRALGVGSLVLLLGLRVGTAGTVAGPFLQRETQAQREAEADRRGALAVFGEALTARRCWLEL